MFIRSDPRYCRDPGLLELGHVKTGMHALRTKMHLGCPAPRRSLPGRSCCPPPPGHLETEPLHLMGVVLFEGPLVGCYFKRSSKGKTTHGIDSRSGNPENAGRRGGGGRKPFGPPSRKEHSQKDWSACLYRTGINHAVVLRHMTMVSMSLRERTCACPPCSQRLVIKASA